MSYSLNDNDYKKILQYYQLDIPKSSRILKKKAEDIIGLKLCSCIKKVGVVNEPKSIGVCTEAVINRKGMKRGKFTCKKPRKIVITKIKKETLSIGTKNTNKNRKTRKTRKI